MRIRLKGLNSITKKLADGTRRTYWYAWKGGPPLRGEPGTPEFIASYNEAVARKVMPPSGKLLSVLQGYQASDEFPGLADSTRRGYIELIKASRKRSAISRCRRLPTGARAASSWHGAIASPPIRSRQADYAWTVLARVLSWGSTAGWSRRTPASTVVDSIADRARTSLDGRRRSRVSQGAPPHLHLPLLLALWTGQRQGDCCGCRGRHTTAPHPPAASQDRRAGRVPVGAPLKAALDAATKRRRSSSPTATASRGRRTAFALVGQGVRGAGIVGVTFNDLRGTAVTRLALVDAPKPRSPPSPGTACATCTRSSTPTTWSAIRRSARTPSGSSNGGTIKCLPN